MARYKLVGRQAGRQALAYAHTFTHAYTCAHDMHAHTHTHTPTIVFNYTHSKYASNKSRNSGRTHYIAANAHDRITCTEADMNMQDDMRYRT